MAWSAHLLASTSDEHVITNAAMYWLTNTGASANRSCYEHKHAESTPSTRPSRPPPRRAWTSFVNDFCPVRRCAERDQKNIVSWIEYPRGGRWVTQTRAT
jgi:epoxide hydrolase